MNELELMQLPGSIESFLSELKPAKKAKWNYELRKYEVDNSPETLERQTAGCELVKSALRDIYSFGETIARGTPKFCRALKRIYDNLRYVEGEDDYYPYGSDLKIKCSMSDYSRSDDNFTKLVGQLGLSSTSAYRYKDLGNFVDEETGDWRSEFQGYSVSLLAEIWTYAGESGNTYRPWLIGLSKIIPANTTISDMRLFRKIMKLHSKSKAPFDNRSAQDRITETKTPLKKVLKIYNELIQKAEEAQQVQVPEAQPALIEYPGQLPGQTLMLSEEPPAEPIKDFPDVGKVSEPKTEAAPMTDSELTKYCLKDESYLKKFQIVRAHAELVRAAFVNFVKDSYGNGGHGGPNDPYLSIDYTPSGGYTIYRLTGGKIVLTWASAAGYISRMIEADEYLTDKEKELYIEWQSEYDGFAVSIPTKQEPDEEPEERDQDFPDVGKVIDIEEPAQCIKRSNREYLTTLSDEQFVSELCLKIIGIFPMHGKSSQFMSTVQSKLKEWLQAEREEQSNG